MKKIIAMLIVLVGFFSFVQNQVTTENSTGSAVLDRIYKKQKIVIGTTADYPPFEWHYINDGKDSVVGIDIDIANAIGEALGVEVEIREMEFNFLIAAMKSGKLDLVLAGITPTEERSKEVAFTNIYYDSHMVAVVKKTDADKFTSLDSFNGANVGAQKRNLSRRNCKRYTDRRNAHVTTEKSDIDFSPATRKTRCSDYG